MVASGINVKTKSVPTIASSTVLAVFNWAPNTQRYKKVEIFVNQFFAKFSEFKKFYGDDLEKFKKMDQDSDGKITHDEYEEYLYNQEDSSSK